MGDGRESHPAEFSCCQENAAAEGSDRVLVGHSFPQSLTKKLLSGSDGSRRRDLPMMQTGPENTSTGLSAQAQRLVETASSCAGHFAHKTHKGFQGSEAARCPDTCIPSCAVFCLTHSPRKTTHCFTLLRPCPDTGTGALPAAPGPEGVHDNVLSGATTHSGATACRQQAALLCFSLTLLLSVPTALPLAAPFTINILSVCLNGINSN